MEDTDPRTTPTQLQEAVDAVLVPRGSAPGQGGARPADRDGQVTWCSAAEEFAARHPRLPVSEEPEDGWGTRCTDVVVDLVRTRDVWHLDRVAVEGHDLDELLTGLGLPDAAARATALRGAAVADCLDPLPRLLADLLDGAGPATGRG